MVMQVMLSVLFSGCGKEFGTDKCFHYLCSNNKIILKVHAPFFKSAAVVPFRGGGGCSPLGLSAPLVLAGPRRAGHGRNPFPHHPGQPDETHFT